MTTITVNNTEINRFDKILKNISRDTGKAMPDLRRQAAVFAVQSATKATGPGTGSKVSTLAKKYKFRPLATIPQGFGYFYEYMSGVIPRIFKTGYEISRGTLKKRGMRRIRKGIKVWNKKQQSWDYWPFSGTKRDISDKRFRIPSAGAAKAGWIGSLPRLGKTADTGQNNGARLSRVIELNLENDISVEITNMVAYVSRIAPSSADIAIRKTESRMLKIYEKRLQRILRNNDR